MAKVILKRMFKKIISEKNLLKAHQPQMPIFVTQWNMFWTSSTMLVSYAPLPGFGTIIAFKISEDNNPSPG